MAQEQNGSAPIGPIDSQFDPYFFDKRAVVFHSDVFRCFPVCFGGFKGRNWKLLVHVGRRLITSFKFDVIQLVPVYRKCYFIGIPTISTHLQEVLLHRYSAIGPRSALSVTFRNHGNCRATFRVRYSVLLNACFDFFVPLP